MADKSDNSKQTLGLFDIPKILSTIPLTQRLIVCVFLVGQVIALVLLFNSSGPERRIAFWATVVWPSVMLIVAVALYCYELIRAGSSPSRSAIGTEPARTDISAAGLRYDLFVSAPMDAFDDDKSFQSNQAVVAKFLLALQTRVGAKQIYFGGAMTDHKAQFDDAGLGYETVRSALESSKSFILIWPQRVPSSCLVEVGIAAARHLPTAIFYRKDVSLPYLLRGKLASRMADKWPVTAYEYADFDALRQIIQLKGAELFPVPLP